jgi:hypothetical protein
MPEQNTILPNMTISDFRISPTSLSPNSFYNWIWILLDIIFIYITIFFIIKISNMATKFIQIWVKPRIILIIIHLFIICILYYFIRVFTPYISVDIGVAIIIIGPMLAVLSDYFKPFTILCKKIVDGKKNIKEIF